MNKYEPFDIELFNIIYSVFPEENGTYTIFKNGEEYLIIQEDGESHWIKLDPNTGIPLFGLDEEVNLIGREIAKIISDLKS